MRRYTKNHEDSLRLEPAVNLTTDDSSCGNFLRWRCAALKERFRYSLIAVRDLVGRLHCADGVIASLRHRLAVIKEHLSGDATKSWVVGCTVAVLVASLMGVLGGVWWMLQQYIGPLLRASAG